MERRELAVRAGISYPYLSEIENGQKEPSYEPLKNLAHALGLAPGELFGLAMAQTTPQAALGDPTEDSSPALPFASKAVGETSVVHSRARKKLKNQLDWRVDQLDDKALELMIELAERLRRPVQ